MFIILKIAWWLYAGLGPNWTKLFSWGELKFNLNENLSEKIAELAEVHWLASGLGAWLSRIHYILGLPICNWALLKMP